MISPHLPRYKPLPVPASDASLLCQSLPMELYRRSKTVHSSQSTYCVTLEKKLSSSMSLIGRGVDHVLRFCVLDSGVEYFAVGLRNCRFVRGQIKLNSLWSAGKYSFCHGTFISVGAKTQF